MEKCSICGETFPSELNHVIEESKGAFLPLRVVCNDCFGSYLRAKRDGGEKWYAAKLSVEGLRTIYVVADRESRRDELKAQYGAGSSETIQRRIETGFGLRYSHSRKGWHYEGNVVDTLQQADPKTVVEVIRLVRKQVQFDQIVLLAVEAAGIVCRSNPPMYFVTSLKGKEFGDLARAFFDGGFKNIGQYESAFLFYLPESAPAQLLESAPAQLPESAPAQLSKPRTSWWQFWRR